MSSTSIAMKVLFDLKRMSSPEVEFLIGLVVVETFIAMIILAIASGMIVNPGANAVGYGQLLIGMAAFYAFFVWVAMWAVPRVVSFFDKIENDELFILFALGIVFLTSGLASLMNVPPIIGAFFIGMILAETKVTARVQSRLESFKDAFVAIFFTAFGMMIDPSMFKSILWMVVLAVPLVILYEAFVMSSIAVFLGFSPKASTTIGTSMCGRGVESILYASVGSKVKGASMSAQLSPFAGAFCFVMSAITPTLVKHSAKLATTFSRILPKSVKFSGAVISRTLGRAVLPSEFKLFKSARVTGVLLSSFVVVCFAVLVTSSTALALFAIAGGAIVVGVFLSTRREIATIVRHVNYSSLGVGPADRGAIVTLVSGVIFGGVLSALLIALSWTVAWYLAVTIAGGYVVVVLCLMAWAYRALYVEGSDVPPSVYHMPTMVIPETIRYPDEPIPETPVPSYGVVRASLNEGHL